MISMPQKIFFASLMAIAAPLTLAKSCFHPHVYNWDNDWFALGGHDRGYTQGALLSWKCDVTTHDESYSLNSWGVQQQLYTPLSKRSLPIFTQDRPYTATMHFKWTHETWGIHDYRAWQVQIGGMGPKAHGEWVQDNFHQLLGRETFEYWDAQQAHAFLWDVDYTQHQRLSHSPWIWIQRYQLGETKTSVQQGIQWSRGLTGGLDVVIPDQSGQSGMWSMAQPDDWFYGARLLGEWVAHDVTLEGPTFRRLASGVNVRRERLQGDIFVGLPLHGGTLIWTLHWFTPHFNQDPSHRNASLTWISHFQ